jgi:hypothetical protein
MTVLWYNRMEDKGMILEQVIRQWLNELKLLTMRGFAFDGVCILCVSGGQPFFSVFSGEFYFIRGTWVHYSYLRIEWVEPLDLKCINRWLFDGRKKQPVVDDLLKQYRGCQARHKKATPPVPTVMPVAHPQPNKKQEESGLILYHASNQIVKVPQWDYVSGDTKPEDIGKKDFGLGFYMCEGTDYPIYLCSGRGKKGEPVFVNKFVLLASAKHELSIFKFAEDWRWLFVVAAHRRNFSDSKVWQTVRGKSKKR